MYNFLTIHKLLLSLNCEVDPSTPFHFMILSNTSYQTPRILKFHSTSWPNISKVNKSNDLDDLDGMGDAIWNFISSVYVSKWDTLYTDHKTDMLRSKISSKFTLRIPPTNSNSKKNSPKSIPVMINKAPPQET